MQVTIKDSERGLAVRRQKYAHYQDNLTAAENRWARELSELHNQGYTILREFVPRQQALGIGVAFTAHCRRGEYLQPARDLRQLAGLKDWTRCPRLTAEDMKKGEAWLHSRTNIAQIEQPLLHFPELAFIALHETILDITGAHLGALPLMSFLKMRKSFASTLPLFDTELFHIDGNSRSLLKGMLFLSDIDAETGPHEFIAGTQGTTQHLTGYERYPRAEMVRQYGEDRIHSITGKAGDFIIEDTTGFHCAGRPVRGDRSLVIFNYVLHPEYGYDAAERATIKLAQDVWDRLSPRQQAAAEELVLI